MDTAHGSVVVEGVTPEDVWSLVSDVTRTGEWSPENTGERWRDGATGPVVGARFQGSNRNGIFYWRTTAAVIAADVGRRFAFDVSAVGIPIARWDWTMSPAPGGTSVALDWTDRRTGPLGARCAAVGCSSWERRSTRPTYRPTSTPRSPACMIGSPGLARGG